MSAGRRLPVLSHLRRPRFSARWIGTLAVIGLLLGAGWLWFRTSSLVAVRQVRVTGLSGPDVTQIRATLSQEAMTMTTLDVSTAKLRSAVSGYDHIAGIAVSAGFPHSLTIRVDETIPVASVSSDGRPVAVDGAGRLLADQSVRGLPSLSGAPDTAGSRVTTPSTLAVLATLRAAPYQLIAHIASARATVAHGIVVTLTDGPQIYFGVTSQLALKWSAAEATLANSNASGATYIDVSAPNRPAAGT